MKVIYKLCSSCHRIVEKKNSTCPFCGGHLTNVYE